MTVSRTAASLHDLIRLLDRHRPPVVLASAQDDPADDTAARRTSWELLCAGLSHLADGGRNGQMGALTAAVSRASLRSAPLASALGIPAPVFALTTDIGPCHTSHAQAVFFARRMTEAVISDIDVSAPIIARALAADSTVSSAAGRAYFDQLCTLHRRHGETVLLMIDRLPPPESARDKNFSF